MQVRVRLFAILRDRAGGRGELTVEIGEGASVGDALHVLAERVPEVAPLLQRVVFAVNQSYASCETILRDGDELALIPPVSGGADDDDWLELRDGPVDVAAVVQFVSTPAAGGIDIFLGTTRAETAADGRRLTSLEYEAYAEMAVREMRAIAAEARGRWPVVRLALLHRTGRVDVAQASVVIAVSTPHRAEAFEACRFVIDALKQRVPIWKREVWDDGTGTWVHPG